jgi:hypothetical protein
MDKPAASSDARLIRLPVDKLSMVFCCTRPLRFKALEAIKDLMLVLITVISNTPKGIWF